MTALEADYYDREASPLGDHTLHPLAPIWESVVDRMRNDDVYDLGCGVGGLALTLAADGYAGGYHGYDFSQRSCDALWEAMGRAYDPGERGFDMEVEVADLRDDPPYRDEGVKGNSWFVLLEVLEHLEDDLDVLRRWVPPGHRVLFSVPNHPSESHVRHFDHPGDVFMRYASLLTFNQWMLVDLSPPPGRAVHLFEARMREDVLS